MLTSLLDSEKVIWAPDGSTFSILANTKVFVYSQSGELKTTLTHTKRVIAMTYLKVPWHIVS